MRTDNIYEIYDFLYFEPQHIGKIKNPKTDYTTPKKMLEHIKNLEVSLNHILNLFFEFLDEHILNDFLKTIFDIDPDFYEINKNFKYLIDESTQPDISLFGTKNFISIELKLGSKSSLEQIMKYGLLHSNFEKTNFMILVGVREFDSFFKQKFFSIENLKSQFQNFYIPEKTKKSKILLDSQKIKSTIQNMNIAYINYQYIKDYFSKISTCDISFSQKKLIDGVVNELCQRKLVS